MYNHVRLRSSRPWACCRVSWTPQYATERILREELALRGADADYIVRREAQLLIDVYLVAAPGADVATTVLPLIRDAASEFAGAYPTDERTAFAVRPDGYLGFAGNDADLDGLTDHLHATFG